MHGRWMHASCDALEAVAIAPLTEREHVGILVRVARARVDRQVFPHRPVLFETHALELQDDVGHILCRRGTIVVERQRD